MARDDIHAKGILVAAAVIAGCVVGAIGFVFGLLRLWQMPPGGDDPRLPYAWNAQPTLLSAPQPQLQRDRADKEHRLRSSGWVDREHRIAHVPIDRAGP